MPQPGSSAGSGAGRGPSRRAPCRTTGRQAAIVDQVVGLMGRLVAGDGGSLRVRSFEPEASRLDIEYHQGVNGHCATCVLDDESLQGFIEEALEKRGLRIAEITVRRA